MPAPVLFYTDFGVAGPYLAQAHAAVLAVEPRLTVLDACSDLPPFDARAAAYLLPAVAAHYPPGSVFVCVVDPGVGTERPAVVLEAGGRWFVGPDNGLFHALAVQQGVTRCQRLAVPADLPSATFHGRDLFAPAAARIALGRLDALKLSPHDTDALRRPGWPDDLAEIVYIDRYGNAMTGLRGQAVPPASVVECRGRRFRPHEKFADVSAGAGLWYVNSLGLVEIAANRAPAATRFGLQVGDPVHVLSS